MIITFFSIIFNLKTLYLINFEIISDHQKIFIIFKNLKNRQIIEFHNEFVEKLIEKSLLHIIGRSVNLSH